MKSVFDVERQDLAALLAPPYRATQIFKSTYQRWVNAFDEMTDIPKAERPRLALEWNIQTPAIHRRFDSNDGTRRYLISLDDGELAETVFIPEEHRNTICISSQVGCALACTFCLTGRSGSSGIFRLEKLSVRSSLLSAITFPWKIAIISTSS